MPFVFLFALFTLYQCFSGIRKGIIYLNTKKKPNQEDKRLIIGGIAGVLGGITGWILFYNLLDNNSYNPALDQWRPYMMAYFILFAIYTSYLGITYKMKDADKAAAFNKKGLVVIIKIALFIISVVIGYLMLKQNGDDLYGFFLILYAFVFLAFFLMRLLDYMP